MGFVSSESDSNVVGVVQLKNSLINNDEKISNILTHLGSDYIHYNPEKKRINCTRPEQGADNPNGIHVYVDNLYVQGITRSYSGDIFTLVMDIKGVSFPKALELVSQWTGYNGNEQEIHFPFGEYYRKYIKNNNSDIPILETYDEKELPNIGCSKKFFQDGISLTVQEDYGLRFDLDADKIIIPVYDQYSRLVGAKYRTNYDSNFSHRWGMTLPFAKSQIVYGWSKNYKSIEQKRTVIVCESEKAVMQLSSMGCNCGVAIGGHSLSNSQVKLIQAFMPDEIVLGYDEDVSEDQILMECSKFRQLPFGHSKISYIYDRNHDILKVHGKQSPTDVGLTGFKTLLKERVKYNGKS